MNGSGLITADRILDLVCKEYGVEPERVLTPYIRKHDYDIVPVRRVYWYLCRQFLPVVRKFGPGTKPKIVIGGANGVARALGVSLFGLRKTTLLVEDLRDDPEFDARLEKLEKSLSGQSGVAFSTAS